MALSYDNFKKQVRACFRKWDKELEDGFDKQRTSDSAMRFTFNHLAVPWLFVYDSKDLWYASRITSGMFSDNMDSAADAMAEVRRKEKENWN